MYQICVQIWLIFDSKTECIFNVNCLHQLCVTATAAEQITFTHFLLFSVHHHPPLLNFDNLSSWRMTLTMSIQSLENFAVVSYFFTLNCASEETAEGARGSMKDSTLFPW